MSHVVSQNSLTYLGNIDLNFQLACEQVVFLKTMANSWPSWSQANNFFEVFSSIYELGGTCITETGDSIHLMYGPEGNS